MILGQCKELSLTTCGYPLVVFSRILVIENIVIKKKHAANVEEPTIYFCNRPLTSETKRLAIIAIENPPNRALIKIVCSASLFRYSKLNSIVHTLYQKRN